MKRCRQKGFSLLEVVIASVILVTVIMISMQMVFVATTTYEEGANSLDLEDRGRELADTLEKVLQNEPGYYLTR